MAKTYMDNQKYMIRVLVEVKGKASKDDIIGAVFGQTEGLLGKDMDLRNLQEHAKIGRLEPEGQITYSPVNNTTTAIFNLPSSLDIEKTVIIAAALETIDKVGPHSAVFTVEKISDTRQEKRAKIKNRAKELLQKFLEEKQIDVGEIEKELREHIAKKNIIQLVPGNDKIVAHKEYDLQDSVIFVEGKADVQNLVYYGIKNVVSVGGVSDVIPDKIREIANKKEVILFLDGDNGAKKVAENLISRGVKIDYIAQAPAGKEVEELVGKEIHTALRKKRYVGSIDFSNRDNLYQLIDSILKESEQNEPEDTEDKPEQIAEQTADTAKPQINHASYLSNIIGKKQALILYRDNNTEITDMKNIIPKLKEKAQEIMAIYIDGLIPDSVISTIASTNAEYLGITNPNAKYTIKSKLGKNNKNIRVVSLDD
ncbi:MAG: toprim domain-containing protein [Candidatus Anstonellales archaeon]